MSEIELVECRIDYVLSHLVRLAANREQELVVIDDSILVEVQRTQQHLAFTLSYVCSQLLEALIEFKPINLPVTIVV